MRSSITIAHQDELVDDYDGQVMVLKNHQEIREYRAEGDAYAETNKTRHRQERSRIQRVSPGTEAYSSTYHSRVSVPIARPKSRLSFRTYCHGLASSLMNNCVAFEGRQLDMK